MASDEEKSPVDRNKANTDKANENRGGEAQRFAETDDDRGDLVIDEPEEKSDGDGESDEKEFEPTIDMMMNDFDDEQTMEEEEANEDQDNEEDELAALEQEQDMPIEELLKMYGAVPSASEPEATAAVAKPEAEVMTETDVKKDEPKEVTTTERPKEAEPMAESHDDCNVEDTAGNAEQTTKRKGSLSPQPPMKKSKSELARFYEAAVEGRALRSQGGSQPEDMEEEDEEEGEDSDFENKEYSWKKTIMIGPSYQASVPSDLAIYGDTLPYGKPI